MIEIIETADGSLSLFDSKLQETYHSKHGAIQESNHVYIQNGLAKCYEKNSKVNILEVGFGTGLNALLTLLYQEQMSLPFDIYYYSLEPFPLKQDIMEKYAVQFSDNHANLFRQLHQAEWNLDVSISKKFVLRKETVAIENFSITNEFDLVYYDAFGPPVQPGLWEKDVLEKTVKALKLGGIWVSYCAKGKVRRDLESLKMQMQRLEGPPGKREILMGRKVPQ